MSDINITNTQGMNLSVANNEKDIIDEISLSFQNNIYDTNMNVESASCCDDDLLIGYSSDPFGFDQNVEDNPIVKEVFNSILENHSIDLSQDPVVVDTLKALLFL